MKVKLVGSTLVVRKELFDSRYYGNYQAAGESKFLYALKNYLNSKGMDLIKKRMWKDGHLVDDCQQYLRARSKKKGIHVAFYNYGFALIGLNEHWNERGSVAVAIDFDIFGVQPDAKERLRNFLELC